jgi:hypothetical protein
MPSRVHVWRVTTLLAVYLTESLIMRSWHVILNSKTYDEIPCLLHTELNNLWRERDMIESYWNKDLTYLTYCNKDVTYCNKDLTYLRVTGTRTWPTWPTATRTWPTATRTWHTWELLEQGLDLLDLLQQGRDLLQQGLDILESYWNKDLTSHTKDE